MLNVLILKQKYPNPVASQPYSHEGKYCVGGAFCLEMGYNKERPAFPFPQEISGYLREANPNLSMARALRFAQYITAYNDASTFDKAWDALDAALEYRRGDD